jgi:hypothetical protein
MKPKACLLLLLLAVGMIQAAVATDQKRSDRVVGYWVSSSGSPITLAYSGKPETFLIRVEIFDEKPLSYTAKWVSDDGGRFTYQTGDGSTINGWVNNANSISVFNPKTNWRAEWKRR